MKVGDFGLARFVREPLRPLSENGVVVSTACSTHHCPPHAEPFRVKIGHALALTQGLLRLQVTIWYRAPELLLGAKHYTR